MKLWQTQRHWEEFGRRNPYWSVLTTYGSAFHSSDLQSFYLSGEEEVDYYMKLVEALAPKFERGKALDFGCGVGRLTRGLARHFASVTGVDIAQSMIALARKNGSSPGNINYRVNTSDHLGRFPNGEFSVVLSIITLQHIEPRYSKRYISEFVRVCVPGGVIVFQVPKDLPRHEGRSRPLTFARRLWQVANRWIALEPKMEMHAIPSSEVEAILTAAGADILAIREGSNIGGGIKSPLYIARKRAHPEGARLTAVRDQADGVSP